MDQQNAAPESASKSEPSAESVPGAIAFESAPLTPATAPEPVSSGGRAWHAVKWMLAMVGVFALHVALQLLVATVAVSASMVGAALGGGDVDAIYNEGIMVTIAITQVLALAIFYPWWVATVAVSASMVGAALGGGDVDAIYNEGIMVTIAITQVLALAIFYPWWRRLCPGSFVERRVGASPAHASAAKTAAILLFIGVAAQFFVSAVLGYVELFFPEPMAEYTEMMEDVGGFTAIATLSTVVLAPISEELVCRGIMLEYALRAVSPSWGPVDRARRIGLSSRAFWIAAVLQAIAFGVLHMNWIQGSYAFALGVVEAWVFWRTGRLRYPILLHLALNGSSALVDPLAPLVNSLPAPLVLVVVEAWVFWRTGRLRYPILLHLALNGSSALVDPLAPLVNSLPAPLVLVVTGALLVGGIKMFGRAWPASDALEPVASESDAAAPVETAPPASADAAPSQVEPIAVSAAPVEPAPTDGLPIPPDELSR